MVSTKLQFIFIPELLRRKNKSSGCYRIYEQTEDTNFESFSHMELSDIYRT